MVPPKFYEGLEAVLYVALNSGAGRVSCKEISSSQGKLPRHLEPVLQLLVHKNFLKAAKGPKGGYTLAKEKRKISLGEIYKAFLKELENKADKSILQKQVMNDLGKDVEDQLERYFSNITIEDLCVRVNLSEKGKKTNTDFNI